jgi:hypothetical protein
MNLVDVRWRLWRPFCWHPLRRQISINFEGARSTGCQRCGLWLRRDGTWAETDR